MRAGLPVSDTNGVRKAGEINASAGREGESKEPRGIKKKKGNEVWEGKRG